MHVVACPVMFGWQCGSVEWYWQSKIVTFLELVLRYDYSVVITGNLAFTMQLYVYAYDDGYVSQSYA